MNNPIPMMQKFRAFCDNFQRINKRPQDVVQELLNTGQMTQQQFEALRIKTNQIMGIKN